MIRKGLLVAALAAGAMIGSAPAQASIQLSAISGIIDQLQNNASFSANNLSFTICQNGTCQTQFTGVSGLQAYNADLTGLNSWAGTSTPATGGFFDNYRFTFSGAGSYFGNPEPQGRNSNPQDFAAPPIPEPATWALMIFGFGLVGYSLRRRATALSFG